MTSNKLKPTALSDTMTVEMLSAKMKKLELSPEKLSEMVPLSNMTIRRLLAKSPGTKISEKHRVLLNPVFQKSPFAEKWQHGSGDLESVVDQLQTDGAQVESVAELKTQLAGKFKLVSGEMIRLAKTLWQYAAMKKDDKSFVTRSIAIGAILYFINPFDLVPDSIPVVGYLDDFAVMTLALSKITQLQASKNKAR